MRKISIVLLLLGLFVSCSSRDKLLDANSVSMTKYHLKKGQKTKTLKDVKGEYCAKAFKGKGSFGLMDEAIKDAQRKSGADFLTNVSFFQDGTCVEVEGTPVKIIK